MSKSTVHAYEVTEVSKGMFKGDEIKPGVVVMYSGHVKSQHEPERIWQSLNINAPVGDPDAVQLMRATHIGEWEKVKKYVGGWRDSNNLVPLVKDFAKWGATLIDEVDPDMPMPLYDEYMYLEERYQALFDEEAAR